MGMTTALESGNKIFISISIDIRDFLWPIVTFKTTFGYYI
jgi:hypothetical protein